MGSRTRGDDADKDLVEQIEANANEEPINRKIDTSVLIPSGLTLLNCACTDNAHGAFARGRIVTVPGGSQGGKTVLMLNMLAEICYHELFDEYDLIYDDGEETMEMFDIPYLFGPRLLPRIVAPAYDEEDEPVHSDTIQDFKAHILNRIAENDKPFIWVLDSLDALTTDEELTREYRLALAKATSDAAVEELKGSYKTEKAKAIGEALRMVNGKLKKSKSALFIVQQVRQKIGALQFERQWVTSGGVSPFFYSTHQIYLSRVKTHNPKIDGIKRKTGTRAKLDIIKNKVTGKERDIQVDIFTDYGMDDIGSCVDFLTTAKTWPKKGAYIVPEGLFGSGETDKFLRRDLVNHIPREGATPELQVLVEGTWKRVDGKFKADRERRFQ